MALIDEINNGTARQTVIHFPNGEHTDITEGFHSGETSLIKTLAEDNDDITFGGCIASKFEATIEGTDDLSNLFIEVSMNIGDYSTKLFKGRVKDCPLQSDRLCRKITAYDEFYFNNDVNVADWYENLDFPITQSAFLTSLLSQVGLTAVSGITLTQTFTINKTLSTNSLKFGEIGRAHV